MRPYEVDKILCWSTNIEEEDDDWINYNDPTTFIISKSYCKRIILAVASDVIINDLRNVEPPSCQKIIF